MIGRGAKTAMAVIAMREEQASAYASIANYGGAGLTTVQVAMCQHRGRSVVHSVVGMNAGRCIRTNRISRTGGKKDLIG